MSDRMEMVAWNGPGSLDLRISQKPSRHNALADIAAEGLSLCHMYFINILWPGAGEIAQRLGVLTAFLKDPSLVSRFLTPCNTSGESNAILWPVHTHSYI